MGFALVGMMALAHVRGHLRASLPVAGRVLPLQRAGRPPFQRVHAGASTTPLGTPPGTKAKGAGGVVPGETTENVFAQRLAKVREMREANVEPFAYSYAPTHRCEALQREYEALGAGEEATDAVVAVSGRVTLKRVFGSLTFLTLSDETGTVQIYMDKKRLGDSFKEIKRWIDIGDIIGASGSPKRTDKGELSVAATDWTMLTKCFRPLPDKWHGLTDVSKRYRQRHLDLIANPEVMTIDGRRSVQTSPNPQTVRQPASVPIHKYKIIIFIIIHCRCARLSGCVRRSHPQSGVGWILATS
jgi:lysyl-tRNA synthetase class 2